LSVKPSLRIAILLLPLGLPTLGGCASSGQSDVAQPRVARATAFTESPAEPVRAAAPAAAAGAAAGPAAAAPVAPLFERANLDPAVSPCQDFYQYANGGWLASHPIPAAHAQWGRFNELEDRNREALQSLLAAAAAKADAAPGNAEQKIGAFYASCLDTAAIEAQGLEPFRPLLKRIAEATDLLSLQSAAASLQGAGADVLFVAGPSPDLKNSTQMILDVLQGGLGLPDRDYYFKDDEATAKIRDEYVQHVARMLQLLGDSAGEAAAGAAVVMDLETELAKGAKTRTERRDVEANYHKMKLAELQALTPLFSWQRYLKDLGAPAVAEVNVRAPDFLKALNAQLALTPLAGWKAYLRWHAADALASALPARFGAEDFHFKQEVLRGIKEDLPRAERCVHSTDQHLGQALGRAYVAKYFPPESRRRARDMVDHLIAALQADLGGLSWMGEETCRQAFAKLDALDKKIGYPDRWIDDSALVLERGAYLTNVLRAREFEFRRQLAMVGRPVDRADWEVSPPTVDAYYNGSRNEIVLPAGILQPPVFAAAADPAFNYGAIGAAIGHEMTHGFDDQGSRFDAAGNLRNWWSAADLANFRARAACVAREYGSFTVQGQKLNGDLVVGEAISDIGGLKITYAAYQKALEGQPRTTVDGFTPEQRFFLAFAQTWAGNLRPEYERLIVATDPHPPIRYRVNGVVANLPEFAQAFGCKAGDPMVRPEGERCAVW
jgi:putative endopeptidase